MARITGGETRRICCSAKTGIELFKKEMVINSKCQVELLIEFCNVSAITNQQDIWCNDKNLKFICGLNRKYRNQLLIQTTEWIFTV